MDEDVQKPKISAMYFLKNEEEFAPFSIRSIYNAVDEIVVVDNGSTDRTRERISRFEKVRWFEYSTDDFSELGNFALSKCQGDWILKIDGDEVFYPDIEQVLPVLAEHDKIDVFTCRFFNLMFGMDHMQNLDPTDQRFERIFLIRNHPGLKYINAVHESLTGIGPVIAESRLHYVHYSYAKPMTFILKKLNNYAAKMGEPYLFEGRTVKNLYEQAERRPFLYEHPPVIKEYIASKGYDGGTSKPCIDLDQLKDYLKQIVSSREIINELEPESKPRCLEIGALPNCITPGWDHLDIRPLPYVDTVGDIRNMPIDDSCYDQVIVPGYLMEHLPYADIVKALQECCRIVKEGGYVMVRAYDGAQIATAYLKGEIDNESFNKLIFGDDRDGWEKHRCILDCVTLITMMEAAGLDHVNLEYYEHWMIQMSGRKPVEAGKEDQGEG